MADITYIAMYIISEIEFNINLFYSVKMAWKVSFDAGTSVGYEECTGSQKKISETVNFTTEKLVWTYMFLNRFGAQHPNLYVNYQNPDILFDHCSKFWSNGNYGHFQSWVSNEKIINFVSIKSMFSVQVQNQSSSKISRPQYSRHDTIHYCRLDSGELGLRVRIAVYLCTIVNLSVNFWISASEKIDSFGIC